MQNILNKIFTIAIWIEELIKTSSTWKIKDSQNSSWEVQAKLDVLSDILVEKKLSELSEIKKLVSEEKEDIINLNEGWKYLIAYDPLDWSSLIDVNLSVWTIFWIYENDFNWSDLVASCYIVYWPRLEVVFADKNGVKFYRYISWEFEEIVLEKLNNKWKILSPWAKKCFWPEYHNNIINNFWKEEYQLRYSGWMVPDLHQILLKWGWLFTYPELTNKPEGKLRKLFEVFPFAFIFEKLWWQAIDKNWSRILDLWYKNLHESTSCYFGSSSEITKVKNFLTNK